MLRAALCTRRVGAPELPQHPAPHAPLALLTVPGGVVEISGTAGGSEVALWRPPGGGTLITCDALQNHADGPHTSTLTRVLGPLAGFGGGVIVAKVCRLRQRLRGRAAP